MKQNSIFALLTAALLAFMWSGMASAGTTLNAQVQALMSSYQKEAGVAAFSAEEGKKLFLSKRVHSSKEERSCTTCHTSDPAKAGKSTVGKLIDPLSPAVNKDRFTDPKKIEKWFKRNCEWTLERACTPKEKGDFVTFMISQ